MTSRRGRTGGDYLERKGRLWYFQGRIPRDLQEAFGGKTRLSVPLGTTDEKEARDRVRPHVERFKRTIRELRALPPAARAKVAVDAWWAKEQAAVEKLRRAVFDVPRAEHELAKTIAEATGEVQFFYRTADPDEEAALAEAQRLGARTDANERAMLAASGVDEGFYRATQLKRFQLDTMLKVPVELPASAYALSESDRALLLRGREQSWQAAYLEFEKEVLADEAKLRRAGIGTVLMPREGTPRAALRQRDPSRPTILEAFDVFLKESGLDAHTLRKYEPHVRRLSQLLDDPDVAAITSEQIDQYIEAMKAMPDTRHLRRKDKTRSMPDLIAMRAADPSLHPMGVPTVRKAYEHVSRFLTFCRSKQWITGNPAKDVAIKPKYRITKAQKKKSFTPTQMRDILAALPQRFNKGARDTDLCWLFKVMTWTGASPEEVAQLDRTNVYKKGATWLIDINDEGERGVKNENRVRVVPLHPALIRQGFLEFVEGDRKTDDGGDQNTQLFQTFVRDEKGYLNGDPSRRFMRWLRVQMKITDKRLTLYSVRHRFHDAMRDADVPLGVQYEIVGHIDQDSPVHQKYGDGSNLRKLAGWMAKVDPLNDPD